MIQHLGTRAKAGRATAHNRIHCRDGRRNFSNDLLGRNSSWEANGWRLSSLWHVAESHHDECASALLPVGRRCEGLGRCYHALKSLYGAGVGQIEMLEYFGRRPFSRHCSPELLRGKTRHGRADFTLQCGEARVHACHLPFSGFQIELLPQSRTHSTL
jgi:hypothetical protein